MNKSLSSALVLSAALALAACDNTPESKLESAKASASDAVQNIGDAANDAADAIKQQANEALGHEPTLGEQVQNAADQASDALKDAGDKAKDALDKD